MFTDAPQVLTLLTKFGTQLPLGFSEVVAARGAHGKGEKRGAFSHFTLSLPMFLCPFEAFPSRVTSAEIPKKQMGKK